NKYGADLLRLWAGSADYHVDVRCSDNIFKQLSQNYLKFRNTCKFILDNLVDFDPENLTAPADMLALDRWVLTQTNRLMDKAEEAYKNYEFHIITHAVNDFCVTTLSSFYLDIVKDRLYCDEADSASRRSAQSALYLVLSTLAKLFAPILCFTCDEIWLAMPHRKGDDARNVLFNDMNKPFAEYDLGDCVSWASLIQLRTGVNAALEAARAEKKIGKALEAHVTLVKDASYPNDNLKSLEEDFADQWADLFIVSDVEVSSDPQLYAAAAETPIAGVRVLVSEAKGVKCPRCWKHSEDAHAETGLCPRCAAVVAKIPMAIEE
ncbi:MAG: class I tRNA ligase family protein, partial [Oscillospiraceae bacterium]|nr:class I tRNA ligase family protein [Oscillospiraceae bacterium]